MSVPYFVPSLYIPPLPGVHYVGRSPSSGSSPSPAAGNFYSNARYGTPPPSSSGYYPAAFGVGASGERLPYLPPAPEPLNRPTSHIDHRPFANSSINSWNAPTAGTPPLKTDLLQHLMADQNIRTGMDAFIKGAGIALIPALFLGIHSLITRRALGLNYPRGGFCKSLLLGALLTLVAMGIGGAVSAQWAMKSRIRKAFSNNRQQAAIPVRKPPYFSPN